MPQLAAIDYKNLQQGLITEGSVAESQFPLNAVSESINWNFDKIGSAIIRPGTTALGQQLTGNCLGLYEFRNSTGSNNQIISVFGTTVYYLATNTWTSIRTVTTGKKARFTTFLNFAWMVNGTDATAIWDGVVGDGWVTTGNASGAPIGQFIENFRSRVWIAGNSTYPDRIYYSEIPTAATTPVVTWNTDVSTGNWIDISPQDGDTITGMKRSSDALLIFKKSHLYRVYSISETEPDPKINVGTWSNESIVEAKDGIYFHSPTGFYQYTSSGLSEISRPIIDIVHAITLANWSTVCGWSDDDHVYWAVGAVAYNGVSYSNMVVRYTNSTQVWTHYNYPTQFLARSDYNDSSVINKLVGDNNGSILKTNTGTTDAGTPINYSLVHRWYSIDGFQSTQDNITNMCFVHQHGTGTKVEYQIDNDLPTTWRPLGKTFSDYDTLYTSISIKGRRVRFKLSGTSTGAGFEYKGWELNSVDSEPVKF